MHVKMTALYEDVEKFFAGIFGWLGRFVARHPIVFIMVSLITSLLLGLGLVNITYEPQVEKLYTPMGSQAFKDQATVQGMFPDNTGDAYFYHQLVNLGAYAELLVTALDGGDVLRPDILREIMQLKLDLLDLTLGSDLNRGHTFTDLCAVRYGSCVIDGESVLDTVVHSGCMLTKNFSYKIKDSTGYEQDISHFVSNLSKDSFCLKAKCLRLRFNLKHDTAYQRQLSLLWGKQFLDLLERFSPVNSSVVYTVSESLDIELAEHMEGDVMFFSLTILIMIAYSTLATLGGDMVSTRMMLSCAGVTAALLAIVATSGLLSMCGLAFVDICGVMPFLVLGIGVDNMFILMSGYRQTDIRMATEDRMSETYRSSAISVTITSLTDLLALCIGATSPFLSIRNFCIYAGVAVFFCYINQLTFFGGCLVLHTRRVLASRHCVTCRPTKPRLELEEKGAGRLEAMLCGGHPPSHNDESESPCEKIPSSYLPRFLLHDTCKILVLSVFLFYLGLSIWGASQIKIGLKLENIVPQSSYLSRYLIDRQRFFMEMGPPVMFVVTGHVEYNNAAVSKDIHAVLKRAREAHHMNTNFQISWLKSYDEYLAKQQPINPDLSTEEYLRKLRDDFLPENAHFEHDIQWNQEKTAIMSSRFYVSSLYLNDSAAEGNMMRIMREIAKNSSVPFIAYSPYFIYYEHYVSVLKNTLLAVGVAIIGMLFIALMFIPHAISIICVTLTMVSIVVGMFGFMYFWGLELSAITSVQIILSVGFCVDFTIHISHAFMAATGKNRNRRVIAAMDKVGVPILNGAITSILGILMLAFAKSYVFRSFFKTMLLVMLFGLFHSTMLLPVLLSFVGPRRTNRPRVFIPMAASARSALSGPSPSCHSPKPGQGHGGSTCAIEVADHHEPVAHSSKSGNVKRQHRDSELRIEPVPEETAELLSDEYTFPARAKQLLVQDEMDSSVMDESFEDAKSLLGDDVESVTFGGKPLIRVRRDIDGGDSEDSSNGTDDTLVKSSEKLSKAARSKGPGHAKKAYIVKESTI